MAVFVRDSIQASRITIQNPRALYFNDTVAAGWVRGGFIELALQDPEQGVVFYTLTGRPQIARNGAAGRREDAIYRRMWEILSGAEKDKRYGRLRLQDRRAIVEILRDTKKDLPDYFRTVTR